MIGYALLGSNDVPRAAAFYDAILGLLGAKRFMETDHEVIWAASMDKPAFGVIRPFDGKAATVGNGSMVALSADSRAKVDEIHAKALAMGGQDEGAPGLRGEEGPQAFYGAYFRDLDGNKVCVFKMGPAA